MADRIVDLGTGSIVGAGVSAAAGEAISSAPGEALGHEAAVSWGRAVSLGADEEPEDWLAGFVKDAVNHEVPGETGESTTVTAG